MVPGSACKMKKCRKAGGGVTDLFEVIAYLEGRGRMLTE